MMVGTRPSFPAFTLIGLLLLLALAGCAPVQEVVPILRPTPEPELIRITGAQAMEPLLSELARAYARERPQVILQVTGGGSAWGLAALRSGEAEIGMVSHPLSEAEIAAEEPRLEPIPIARDGIAFIANPANPINRIRREELSAIFNGDTFEWDSLGWLAGTIDLVSREAGSGDRAVVEAFALSNGRPLSPNALLMPSPDAVVAHVASTPNALGYVSLAQLSGVVKPLRLDEIAPTEESLANGSYPLTRELLLVTAGPASGEVQRFLAWVLGPAGRAIIERRYLPLTQ